MRVKNSEFVMHTLPSRYDGYVPWKIADIMRDLDRYIVEYTNWMMYLHPAQYISAPDSHIDLDIHQYTVWGQLIKNPSEELYDLQLMLHERYKLLLSENSTELHRLCDKVEIRFFFDKPTYLKICNKLNIKSRWWDYPTT